MRKKWRKTPFAEQDKEIIGECKLFCVTAYY